MKLGKIIIFLIVVLIAGAGIFFWWKNSAVKTGETTTTKTGVNKQGRRKKVPLVEVQPARVGEMAHTLELTGEVIATNAVVIAATTEGPIVYSPWREGDEVRTGEKLVEIERDVYRAEVQAAKAALAVAEAKLADLKVGARPEEINKAEANVVRCQATSAEARKAYQRQLKLIKQDFTSQQSVDQAREKMDVAEAELRFAKEVLRMLKVGPTATELAVQEATVNEAAARLALAEAHLAECVISAPFDGKITRVHVRSGDLAVSRSPLVEMYSPASLIMRFSVPEVYSSAMRSGLRLEATLDAFPGRTFRGEVVRAYPQLDPVTRTRTVEAKLEHTDELMPHQFARMTLHMKTVKDAVIIPAEAVIESLQGGRIAFVVKKSKAELRKIELGIESAQSVQVTKGISPGELVVVRGNESLKNGANVRIPSAGKSTPNSAERQKGTPADKKPENVEGAK